MTRIFVPVTGKDVEAILARESFRPSLGVGVTASLRERWPDEDDEGLEYLATQCAAAASDGSRVAVAALEVTPESFVVAETTDAPGLVRFAADVAGRDVVCFLLADAGVHVNEDEELELSWYDVSEAGLVAAELKRH